MTTTTSDTKVQPLGWHRQWHHVYSQRPETEDTKACIHRQGQHGFDPTAAYTQNDSSMSNNELEAKFDVYDCLVVNVNNQILSKKHIFSSKLVSVIPIIFI